eukprot:gb/GECG01007580.1/.p1 GENE.gb/GECG01007580.1/~~gb/GECG01007580.1/.p1  ORF type:complete len:478 (+),score=37.43 gb/GECG01007580.1/:1-1434(+)
MRRTQSAAAWLQDRETEQTIASNTETVSIQTVIQDAHNVINLGIKLCTGLSIAIWIYVYFTSRFLLDLPTVDLYSEAIPWKWVIAWVLLLLPLALDCVSLYCIWYSYRFLRRVWCRPVRVDGKEATEEVINELIARAPHNEDRLVQAIYTDRLGNHVFQYCYARMFAMLVGANFEAKPISKPFDSLPTCIPANPAASDKFCEGYSLEPTTSKRERTKSIGLTKKAYEETKKNEVDKKREKVLRNWFQYPVSQYAQDLYIFNIALLKKWVKESVDKCSERDGSKVPQFDKSELVIHVRLGDILWGHHAAYRPLPFSFYREAIATFSGSLPPKITLVTESRNHSIIRRLRDHLEEYTANLHLQEGSDQNFAGVHVQSEDMVTDFLTLYHAPRLVFSVSTFCWWAGFLGDSAIIYPIVGVFRPSPWTTGASDTADYTDFRGKYPIQDLLFPKEDSERVTYIDCSHLKRWEGKHEISTLFD